MRKNKKFRVLFAISNLTYGGIQTQTLSLAKGLQSKGARVYFFWTNKAEKDFVDCELLANSFKIIDGRFIEKKSLQQYSWRLGRYLPLIKTILLLRFYKIDYVIPYQNRLSYFFGSIHKFTGVKKTIFHIRNTVLETKPKKNWYLQHALKNNPIIIANSNHARIKFKQIYGQHYNLNIQTIYNGIEIRTVNDNINWKKHFEVESIEFIVSVIANFFNEKDFITVFKAWKNFTEISNSNSILLIAGDEGVKGLRNFYENQVKELQIDNKVKFLGRTPYNIELLSIVDCNILSSENEGLPNSAIETLAMSKPLLATNIEGIREVVGSEYPVPLFQIKDSHELASILLKVFNKELNLHQLKDYSIKRSKKFTIDKLNTQYSRILEI